MTTNEDIALPRPVRDSQSEMAEIVLPNDANMLGALLGGYLFQFGFLWTGLASAACTLVALLVVVGFVSERVGV